MLVTIQTDAALSAEMIAVNADRKQNRRLAAGFAISAAVNVLFLVGAARGMEEKPFADSAPDAPGTVVIFAAPPPATPTPTPAPAPAASVTPVVEVTPKPRRPSPVVPTPTPKPEVTPVAKNEKDTPISPVPTQPESVSDSAAAPTSTAPAMTASAQPRDSDAARTQTGVALSARGGAAEAPGDLSAPGANAGLSAAGGPALPGASTRSPRIAEGDPNTGSAAAGTFLRSNITKGGTPALRGSTTGIATASTAASGLFAPRGSAGESDANGGQGISAGARPSVSSGPSLGGLGEGKRRGTFLTQINDGQGGTAQDFTVGHGEGLTPGAIVQRKSGAGNSFVNGGATLAPRVFGGGSNSSSGGTGDSALVRSSAGIIGGSSNGPVGRKDGIDTGNAPAAGGFGRQAGVGDGRGDVGDRGTGTAANAPRADVALAASGGRKAEILSSRLPIQENRADNRFAAKSEPAKKHTVGAPKAGDDLNPALNPAADETPKPGVHVITDARVLESAKPVITDEEKATGPRSVTVEFIIAPGGTCTYRMTGAGSGNSDVDAAVLKACARYRWSAARRDGVAVETRQRIVFDPNAG